MGPLKAWLLHGITFRRDSGKPKVIADAIAVPALSQSDRDPAQTSEILINSRRALRHMVNERFMGDVHLRMRSRSLY